METPSSVSLRTENRVPTEGRYALRRVGLIALLLALAGLGGARIAEAQTSGTVRGRVVAATTMRPLAGAQVIVAGTGRGSLTNSAGEFLIAGVPTGTHSVRVQMLGYGAAEKSVTVAEGPAARVDFELTETAISLDEVVVTGTAGAARRREIGNSVASLNEQLLEVKPVQNISSILQGEVAGLTQFTSEGQVGAGTVIRLRGNNSITQGNEPLIYIDGIRMTSAKNPGAAGSQQKGSPLDNLNPQDIARVEIIKGAAATTLYGTEANGGVIQIFTKSGGDGRAVWSFEANTGARFLTANAFGPVVGEHETYLSMKPWLETGASGDLSGSVRGSAQGVSYYLSGEYSDAAGVMPTQGSARSGFRANFGFEPFRGMRVNVNSAYSHRVTDWLQSGDNGNGVVLNLLRSPLNNTAGRDSVLFDQETSSLDDHVVAGVTFNYSPVAALSNRLTFGMDWVDGLNEYTIPFGHLFLPAGRRQTNRWRHTTLTMDYAGTLTNRLSQSINSSFSWGFQAFEDRDHRQWGTSEGFAGPGRQTLATGSLRSSDEEILRTVNAGLFLQEMLGFQDRLFITAGLRVDGNSAFGEDFGLQPYPKISASYVLSDNSFWPEWWETMKLRAAIGESGKAPGAFDAVQTWEPATGYETRSGVQPENLGDPSLGPERTREIEAGFEGAAMDNRVSFDFSVYQAETRDALIEVQFPPSQGFQQPQLKNVGKIRNRGLELTLNVTPVRMESFTWDARFQVGLNESEATDLGGAAIPIGFQSWRTWVKEGYPVPGYWGLKVQNPDEIANPVYSQEDEFFGGLYPTRTFGVGSTFQFLRSFTLYALAEGAGGHYMLNGVARQNAIRGLWPQCQEYANRLNETPAIWRARCSSNPGWEVWTFPADYVKLRNISLTYQIPQGLIPQASNASFTLSGQNLWKWTDYPGLDPEITRGDEDSLARREYYHLPPATYISATFRVTF